MSKKIQSIKGMNDILPGESSAWQYVEQQLRQLLLAYGYREIRFPVLEQTELFKRSIGEVTDIVEKEMYTFEDLNGDSLTLRPEGTACCVRAAEQHGLLYNQIQRLWYMGPMFRHENPQKGRYRQFHQLGVEVFGLQGPDIDAELIIMMAQFWQDLGMDHVVDLELNSLGSLESRQRYRQVLVDYLVAHKDLLDSDSQRRLSTNPLRVLDSKDSRTQQILEQAPLFSDYLDDESQQHFGQLCAFLDKAGIRYRVNPKLVRGLDYYCKTVFEWVTTTLGAQGTVCAGGRYDGLVQQLGGKSTPAVGFAMGLERLILILQDLQKIPEKALKQVDIYIVVANVSLQSQAFELSRQLRKTLRNLKVYTHCGGGKFNNQMKKAYNSGSRFAVILEKPSDMPEIADAVDDVKVKYLDDNKKQDTVPVEGLVNYFLNIETGQ